MYLHCVTVALFLFLLLLLQACVCVILYVVTGRMRMRVTTTTTTASTYDLLIESIHSAGLIIIRSRTRRHAQYWCQMKQLAKMHVYAMDARSFAVMLSAGQPINIYTCISRQKQKRNSRRNKFKVSLLAVNEIEEAAVHSTVGLVE